MAGKLWIKDTPKAAITSVEWGLRVSEVCTVEFAWDPLKSSINLILFGCCNPKRRLMMLPASSSSGWKGPTSQPASFSWKVFSMTALSSSGEPLDRMLCSISLFPNAADCPKNFDGHASRQESCAEQASVGHFSHQLCALSDLLNHTHIWTVVNFQHFP